MTDESIESVENMGQAKACLQRLGFLARERPTDDLLDSETWTALYLFAESRGFAWSLESFEEEDGEIPPGVMAALLDPMLQMSFSAESEDELTFDDEVIERDPNDLSTVEVFDLTGEHELNTAKVKKRPRSYEQITTIILHQTGVKFGVGKKAEAKYGRRVALHRRFYDVACHTAALMNGDVLYVNNWERYVLHGHGSNSFSIGIEIEGLYAGIAGNPKTVSGKNANTLTPTTIAAARRAVEYSVQECRELGCPITKIAAHRNFHRSRISDPGEEIWREVALWAVEALDLSIDYDLAKQNKKDPKKSGLKIPRAWDPAALVDYRGRPL